MQVSVTTPAITFGSKPNYPSNTSMLRLLTGRGVSFFYGIGMVLSFILSQSIRLKSQRRKRS